MTRPSNKARTVCIERGYSKVWWSDQIMILVDLQFLASLEFISTYFYDCFYVKMLKKRAAAVPMVLWHQAVTKSRLRNFRDSQFSVLRNCAILTRFWFRSRFRLLPCSLHNLKKNLKRNFNSIIFLLKLDGNVDCNLELFNLFFFSDSF